MGNRHIKSILLLITLLLVSTNSVLAGINSPYWSTNFLKMYPGETKDVNFVLVHGTEEKTDIKAIASLIEGSEIAEIIGDKEFALSPGTLVEDNKRVVLRISIPKNANIGASYNIKFNVKSSPQEKTGNVQLGTVYDIDFPVIVAEKSEVSEEKVIPPVKTEKFKKINTNTIVIISIILIALIIIFILFLKKKQEVK